MKKIKAIRTGASNYSSDKSKGEFKEILLDEIIVVSNVRTEYQEDSIKELAGSIEREGLLQPILVIPEGQEDGRPLFRVIEGHRRLKAYKYLRDQKKPTYNQIRAVIRQNLNDIETVQLIANIQREDLSPGDLEKAVKSIMKRESLKQAELSKRVGKSKVWVSKILKAEKIREDYKKSFVDETFIEELPSNTLYELSGIKDSEKRNKAIKTVHKKGGTQKIAREEAKKSLADKPIKKEPKKAHHKRVNQFYIDAERMDDTQLLHITTSVIGECLIRLKGKSRTKAIEEINKIIKQYK